MTPSELMPFILLAFGDVIGIYAIMTVGFTANVNAALFWTVLCNAGCFGIVAFRRWAPV